MTREKLPDKLCVSSNDKLNALDLLVTQHSGMFFLKLCVLNAQCRHLPSCVHLRLLRLTDLWILHSKNFFVRFSGQALRYPALAAFLQLLHADLAPSQPVCHQGQWRSYLVAEIAQYQCTDFTVIRCAITSAKPVDSMSAESLLSNACSPSEWIASASISKNSSRCAWLPPI